jgi:hypothetical protein
MTMSPDTAGAKAFAVGLIKSNDRIGDVVTEWQWVVRPDEAAQFQAFSDRIRQFQESRRELVRRGAAGGPAAAREWADSAPIATCAARSTRTWTHSSSSIPTVRSTSTRRSTAASKPPPGCSA